MVDVFITVDVEVWPFQPRWPLVSLPTPHPDLSRELDRYILGATPDGNFGVGYQCDRLNAFGLKGTFFVEALCADVVGQRPIAGVVDLIDRAGQEVQLHVHTEWLGDCAVQGLPARPRQNLQEFSLAEQTSIVGRALQNLRACGATDIVALRAGNCGANLDTLRAARSHGLQFDSSYDCAALDGSDLASLGDILGPTDVGGIVEIPVSHFSDYPGHLRHVQLCACSFAEMRDALMWAWRDKWSTFVLILHSFELIRDYRKAAIAPSVHRSNLSRFERVCEFLAQNPDKFRTQHFRNFAQASASPAPSACRTHRSGLHRTLHRYAEQAISRLG